MTDQYRLRMGAAILRSRLSGLDSTPGGGAKACSRRTRLLQVLSQYEGHTGREGHLLNGEIRATFIKGQIDLLLSLSRMRLEVLLDPFLSVWFRCFMHPMKATFKCTSPKIAGSLRLCGWQVILYDVELQILSREELTTRRSVRGTVRGWIREVF